MKKNIVNKIRLCENTCNFLRINLKWVRMESKKKERSNNNNNNKKRVYKRD